MNDAQDPNQTVDVPSSTPADSLDAGLAAGFGTPRSRLDASQRPELLEEAQGESEQVETPPSSWSLPVQAWVAVGSRLHRSSTSTRPARCRMVAQAAAADFVRADIKELVLILVLVGQGQTVLDITYY